jgi:hypothetical protein
MKRFVLAIGCGAALAFSGCALYNDISIGPLQIKPADVRPRGVSLQELVDSGEFGRAAAMGSLIDAKPSPGWRELAALGKAELACGRLNAARRHLRAALDANPFVRDIPLIAWDLSQVEFLANDFAAAHEWAVYARDRGLNIREWHFQYLTVLSDRRINRMPAPVAVTLPMLSYNPRIPRVEVTVDGSEPVSAVIDTGAVLSIVSESFAASRQLERLGTFRGTFYGLLGEPIDVSFAMIRELSLGGLVIHDVPVAVMPDSTLRFVVLNREPFKMDLLLGVNLLKEFMLEFDYRHDRLLFRPLRPVDRTPAVDQNLFFVGFRPFVQTAINRRGWFLFIIDSGSEVTFLNQHELDRTNVRSLPKYHGALLQGLGGAQKAGAKIEDVEIGVDQWAGIFRSLPLYNAEQSQAVGILGQNFLRHFRVTLDFGSMRLDLDRK